MPTYVYHCESCDADFEARQRFSDDPLSECPQGHEGVRRVIRPAGIIFKGSGWYIKDSRNGSSNGKSDKAGSATPSEGEGGASAKSEPKAESKAESKTESKSKSEAA